MITKIPYKTSMDYKRLQELCDKGYAVVCFVTYDFLNGREEKPLMVTDVAICNKSKDGTYRIHSRGNGYGDTAYYNGVTLSWLCDHYKLQFIDIDEYAQHIKK